MTCFLGAAEAVGQKTGWCFRSSLWEKAPSACRHARVCRTQAVLRSLLEARLSHCDIAVEVFRSNVKSAASLWQCHHLRMMLERGEKTSTPKISALLRKRPVLLRANVVLTKDRKRPYYGHFCGKIHGWGLVVKRPELLSKVQMLNLALGVGGLFPSSACVCRVVRSLPGPLMFRTSCLG